MSLKLSVRVLAALGAMVCVFVSGSVAPEIVAAETNRRVERIQARALKDSCKTVRAIRGGEIWKSIASTHIPHSDPRRNTGNTTVYLGVGGGQCIQLSSANRSFNSSVC